MSSVVAEMCAAGPLLGLGETQTPFAAEANSLFGLTLAPGPLTAPLGTHVSNVSHAGVALPAVAPLGPAPLAKKPKAQAKTKANLGPLPPSEFDDWTKEELSKACKELGISRTGTRADLIRYLQNPTEAPKGRGGGPRRKRKHGDEAGAGAGADHASPKSEGSSRATSPAPLGDAAAAAASVLAGAGSGARPPKAPTSSSKKRKTGGTKAADPNRLTTQSVMRKHGLNQPLKAYEACFRKWLSQRTPAQLDQMLGTRCRDMPDPYGSYYIEEVCQNYLSEEYEDATMGQFLAEDLGASSGDTYYSFCQNEWHTGENGWIHMRGECMKGGLSFFAGGNDYNY